MIRGIVSLLRPADHAIFLTLVIMRGDQRLFFLLLHCAITLIEFTKPTNVRVQYYDDLLSHPSLTSNSSTLINKVSPEASWGGLWTEQKRQIELTKGQAQKWHFGRELRRQQYLRLINYLLKELSSHVEMYDFSLCYELLRHWTVEHTINTQRKEEDEDVHDWIDSFYKAKWFSKKVFELYNFLSSFKSKTMIDQTSWHTNSGLQ